MTILQNKNYYSHFINWVKQDDEIEIMGWESNNSMCWTNIKIPGGVSVDGDFQLNIANSTCIFAQIPSPNSSTMIVKKLKGLKALRGKKKED